MLVLLWKLLDGVVSGVLMVVPSWLLVGGLALLASMQLMGVPVAETLGTALLEGLTWLYDAAVYWLNQLLADAGWSL